MAIDKTTETETIISDFQVVLPDTSQDISLVSTKGTLDVRFGSSSVWLTDSTVVCAYVIATG